MHVKSISYESGIEHALKQAMLTKFKGARDSLSPSSVKRNIQFMGHQNNTDQKKNYVSIDCINAWNKSRKSIQDTPSPVAAACTLSPLTPRNVSNMYHGDDGDTPLSSNIDDSRRRKSRASRGSSSSTHFNFE